MNIIHISLGLPPLRTGGLTRYCCELMEAQVSHGHEVSLIFPGRFLPGGVRFFRGNWHGIYTYELINPLPVALTYGVADPEHFLTSCPDVTIFERVVRDISPDVIHVHSFMGIYIGSFSRLPNGSVSLWFSQLMIIIPCVRVVLSSMLRDVIAVQLRLLDLVLYVVRAA